MIMDSVSNMFKRQASGCNSPLVQVPSASECHHVGGCRLCSHSAWVSRLGPTCCEILASSQYRTGKFSLDILNGEDMIVFDFKPPQIQHGVALVGATRRCKFRDRRGGCKLI